jgi:hypothetical protein
MQAPRAFWKQWSVTLHRLGLEPFAAIALEAGRPFGLLGAQLLYMGQPFLRPAWTDEQIESLASMLEDQNETQAFAAFLREGKSK